MVDNGSEREALTQAALVERLREQILSGEYEPGTQLSEVRLSQHFNVSRTPVRESFKQLQVEGLVEIKPKVGTFVRATTRREILEMFEVKEVLEGLAARLMARRGPIPELKVLEANVLASEAAAARGDSDEYAQLVKEFHETIMLGADNRKLAEHYRTLMNQLAYQRLVIKTVRHPGRLALSTAEHRRVFELISEKDAHGAEQAMRDHVSFSAREAVPELG